MNTNHALLAAQVQDAKSRLQKSDQLLTTIATQAETIRKLTEELAWAWSNMSFLEYENDNAEYETCRVCHNPEWDHKETCQAIPHHIAAHALLAEVKK